MGLGCRRRTMGLAHSHHRRPEEMTGWGQLSTRVVDSTQGRLRRPENRAHLQREPAVQDGVQVEVVPLICKALQTAQQRAVGEGRPRHQGLLRGAQPHTCLWVTFLSPQCALIVSLLSLQSPRRVAVDRPFVARSLLVVVQATLIADFGRKAPGNPGRWQCGKIWTKMNKRLYDNAPAVGIRAEGRGTGHCCRLRPQKAYGWPAVSKAAGVFILI
jgi:hypothetical protein